jgi:hypothetical protein
LSQLSVRPELHDPYRGALRVDRDSGAALSNIGRPDKDLTTKPRHPRRYRVYIGNSQVTDPLRDRLIGSSTLDLCDTSDRS